MLFGIAELQAGVLLRLLCDPPSKVGIFSKVLGVVAPFGKIVTEKPGCD